ncbi:MULTISPECIES: cobalt-precorrin-5B (C(1))-methyltransferase [Flavobacterium]|uniref:Cobalt-precorrin-5B C(1)-methyltransferase n=2 Tax=Flavobacterium TaxID=237 RepID=A0A2N9PCX2_9FLAO|nr:MULTISPECIES: cobalt-precorrin-5B (C(1))-methyltransferase [Flavobacterium]QYS88772.1 cobalt-precorrin-5B (C(1))-methyltransferase [Flavobacterium davisii]RVU89951.1 cobalt-precorrin-5B (C(1))-methyltransferase [Flavobacterium columnare]SPE78157.1 cobalt-precorrin-6A synthase [Flavobacterium columnare]
MALLPVPEGPLRNGYTTGACATACAKAALISLLEQREIKEVTITLPLGQKATFVITSCFLDSESVTCTTIKDAGDDPDVTHGATIGCTISLNETKEIRFLQGKGVGIVTLPGLAIAVGEPAINPVPRKMITDTLNFIKHKLQCDKGINVEIFVENGEEIAQKTLNSRIGILNGISILGTTGIVKAFSSSAYIASITQGIDVAIANGCTEIVINSGGRSENLLKQQFSYLPDIAFIQYGNWIGDTLTKINSVSLKKVNIGIMIGKAAKLAQGELDTHSGKSTWDKEFIYQMARKCGYTDKKCTPILNLNMARRLTEIFDFTMEEPFFQSLQQHCYDVCKKHIPNIELKVFLINANDEVIS